MSHDFRLINARRMTAKHIRRSKKKLKRYLILALAWFLYYSGLIRLWVRYRYCDRHGNSICVLGLHRVLDDAGLKQSDSLPGIVFRESTFVEMVKFLHQYFAVITLDEFISSQSCARTNSKLSCLLTFDDGWADNFTTVLPVFAVHTVPAVIFAVTGLIDTCVTFWVENLSRAWKRDGKSKQLAAAISQHIHEAVFDTDFDSTVEKLKHMPASRRRKILSDSYASSGTQESEAHNDRMLTWDEAQALEKAGVEIEGHTVTHPLLVYEDDQTVRNELSQCKQELEHRLGKRVRAFAYPNGTWDQRVRKMVEEAGYECAFTTEKGWHHPGADRFTIRRIMLHEGMVTGPNGKFSPALLSLRLSGLI